MKTHLIENHWKYIAGVLKSANLPSAQIELVGFHYKTAFEHGWKHCEEHYNIKQEEEIINEDDVFRRFDDRRLCIVISWEETYAE